MSLRAAPRAGNGSAHCGFIVNVVSSTFGRAVGCRIRTALSSESASRSNSITASVSFWPSGLGVVSGCTVVVGVFFIKGANLTPFIPPAQPPSGGSGVLEQPVVQAALGLEQSVYGIAGVVTAAAVVFFAYTGFEALANLGEETINPRKDLRVGILGALAVCAVLYIAVSIVLTGMIPFTDIDTPEDLASLADLGLEGWQ